ncbi:MAG TPA: ATP-binding protein [Rudaea sp.]|uniref:ATP-binding protein n=1 Tax=Rudaea sp. TaxID=2136325 RepID=UPI002F92C623
MSLRFKLLLVALSTLALPLAGWLIVRQMEVLLRQGQEQTLIASAKALARSLAALKTVLPPAGQAFYVHPRVGKIEIDGYGDDWSDLSPYAQNLGPADDAQKLKLLLCADADWLYLLATVRDTTRTRVDANDADALLRDHLTLTLERDGNTQRYLLASAAPGHFDARVLDGDGASGLPQRLGGAWQEDGSGYRVELRLPRAQMPEHLALSLFDAAAPAPERAELRPLLSRSPTLSDDLAQFAPEGMRVRVLSAEGWVVAESGQLEATRLGAGTPDANRKPATSQRRWLENLIYRNLIAPDMTRAQDFATTLPRLAAPEIWQALSGVAATAWHPAPTQDQVVLAAAVPLQEAISSKGGGEVRGALLLEQSGDALPLLTNRALLLLIGASLLALLFAGTVLFVFASVLGVRIRRLRDAAERAMHRSGKMDNAALPLIDARDELGDLARSFSRLLDEVAAYTDYLRTLASKLSHELQTPLAIVKSSLDNLDQQSVSADARTYLVRARGGAERLGAIVRAMSEASRMERAIGGVEGEDFDLAAVVRGCVEAYRPLLAPRRVESDLPAGALVMHGAPELIAQALDKLIDNARSFTPQDGWIRLSLHARTVGATVSVANRGPALPPTMQERLFDSLVSMRAASANKPGDSLPGRADVPHLGLGLYLVRLIAELHRGEARARNLPNGSGVEFSLELRGMPRRPLAG